MQRKYIALLLVFLVLSVFALGFGTNVDRDKISDEEGKLSVSISTKVDLLDANGKQLTIIPFIPQSLVYEGKEVKTMKVTLTWTCGGSEINWTTLEITVKAYKIVREDEVGGTVFIDNVKFMEKEFTDKSKELVITLDMVEAIKPYAAQLEDGQGLSFTIRLVVLASAYDVYGILHEVDPYVARCTAFVKWDEPELTLEAGTDGGGYEILSITKEGEEAETQKTVSPLTVFLIFVVLGGAYWILSRKEH